MENYFQTIERSKKSHSQRIKDSQAASEQETDGTKHDIHRYYRASSGDTDKPQHETEQYRSPKDCINAFPFHRFSFFSGQGFDILLGLVVMLLGTQTRH